MLQAIVGPCVVTCGGSNYPALQSVDMNPTHVLDATRRQLRTSGHKHQCHQVNMQLYLDRESSSTGIPDGATKDTAETQDKMGR